VALVEAKLARFGIPAVGDVVTSAQAAATLVQPGERVLLAGGPGIEGELVRRGCEVVRGVDHGVDAVIVGFHRTFDYEAMRCCAVAVRRGARFIGTNPDTTYPTPDGPIPGGGAILASVAAAAGVAPTVAGKPHAPMAALVRSMVGDAAVVMVGDRHDTDGMFATQLGARFALVLSGVSAEHDVAGMNPAPDLVRADVSAVADALLG
jgi:HAD superfamily hydrolase (TIGR01450 family)